MKIIDKQASRLEANERFIEADDRRLVEIQAQQEQRRREVVVAKEKLVIDLARDAGLLDLSTRRIMQVLSGLKDACGAQPTTSPLVPAQGHSEQEGETSSDGDMRDVAVKISSNASAAKRKVLEAAKLHWNGRREAWIGKATSAAIAQLRLTFGDRVTLHPAAPIAASSGGGSNAPEPLAGGAHALADAAAGDVSVPTGGVSSGVAGPATVAATRPAQSTGGPAAAGDAIAAEDGTG